MYAGHDESRASDAVAPIVRQVEDMLADTASGLPHSLSPEPFSIAFLLYNYYAT